MTGVSRSKSRLSPESHAVGIVSEWLKHRDFMYPATRHFVAHSTYPHVQGLYHTTIPSQWNKLRVQLEGMRMEIQPDERQKLRAGFLALHATTQSRNALMYHQGIRMVEAEEADTYSWKALGKFATDVGANRVPLPDFSKIDLPIEQAVEAYTQAEYGDPLHTYIGMVGLTATLVGHFPDNKTRQLIVPGPGANEKVIHRWDYVPAQLAS